MPKYNTDKPVSNKEEDFFQRYEFSKRIADSIKSYKNPDGIVFGISGVWGEGKTSVLNFIEQELLKSYPNIICLRFNPWRYNDENTLLTSLFNSLAHKIKDSIKNKKQKKEIFGSPTLVEDEDDPLKKERETIGDLLQKYGEIVSYFGLGKAVKSIGKGLSDVDIEKRKKRIEEILKKLEKRLVIFIDDIDRLDRNEIYSILKIVKLTGDFKYMTYILSFDDDMVASAIGERFGEGDFKSGKNFLEKIIQIPLKIPKAQKSALKKFCFKNVDLAIEESKIKLSEDEVQRFVREFTSHILNRLNTPRLAVRYGNALQFSLPIMIGEVNKVDLMLIEAVKIFFSEFYEFIKSNPDYFVGAYKNSYDRRKNNTKIEKVKNEIAQLSEDYSDIDKTGIQLLLQDIFPQLNEVYNNYHYTSDSYNIWYNQKRICSPEYFDRYFTYSLQEGEMSDVDFEGIISELETTPIDDLSQRFKKLIEKSSIDDFVTKVRSQEKIYTWEEAKKIANSLVLFSELFPKTSPNSFFGFGSPLSQIAIFISQLIEKGSTREEKFQFAKGLMLKANTFAFSYEINRWLRRGKDEEKIFEIGEYQELAKILIDRAIKESGGKSIFETHDNYITYMISSWNEIDKIELWDYVESILKKDKNNVLQILKACTPTISSTRYPQPYKSDFTQEQFNLLKNVLDFELVHKKIEEWNNGKVDISDVKFSHMEPNPSLENIAKQFEHWYKNDKEKEKR